MNTQAAAPATAAPQAAAPEAGAAGPPTAPKRSSREMRLRVFGIAERYILVFFLALVIIIFAFLSKTSATFPTKANFDTNINSQAVLVIVALASIFPLICGRFDLSVGAVLGLSSIASAGLFENDHAGLFLAILGGIGTGAGIGVINGLLVTKARVNAFITTLGTSSVVTGIAVYATGNNPITNGIPSSLTNLSGGSFLTLPTVTFILIVTAVLVYYVLESTPYGRRLHAVGSSERAAKLVGISTDRTVLVAFVISGALAGAAGVIQLAQSGAGDPSVGPDFTLPAIAAAFLGATAIKPGRFNVIGTIVAIAFLSALLSGLTLMGAQGWVQDVVDGTALVAGVAGSTFMARQRLNR